MTHILSNRNSIATLYTIDFSTGTLVFQRPLPKIIDLFSSVFTLANNYYAAGNNVNIEI